MAKTIMVHLAAVGLVWLVLLECEARAADELEELSLAPARQLLAAGRHLEEGLQAAGWRQHEHQQQRELENGRRAWPLERAASRAEASLAEASLTERAVNASAFDLWDERLLLDILPIILGQRGCNENGSLEAFRDQLLEDEANEDIMLSSAEEIIERSGFQYERHETLSDDGYWTRLTRLKNPLMAGRPLKQPPVVLLEPAAIGPAAFIWASAGQHHPEGPDGRESARSWNRSLAFVLANRGYDVWLTETRGQRSKMAPKKRPLQRAANSLDKGGKSIASLLFGQNRLKNMTLADSLVQLSRVPHYWTYSFDEIVQHEMRVQLDKVLEVSGAANLSLVSYSFASMVALPFLAVQGQFARERLHSLVLMAPILSSRGANTLANYLYEHACLGLPDDLIAYFGTAQILTRPLRALFVQLARGSAKLRYKALKFLFYLFQGPSAHYRTFLEPAVYGHLLEPVSLLQVKHFCQQVLARNYQRYDFGALRNLLLYGQPEPPVYDMGRIELRPAGWLLVSADNDNLATRDSVEQLLAELRPGPAGHIRAAGFAHLDLVAGVDNDVHVNLPILDYLEQDHYYLD